MVRCRDESSDAFQLSGRHNVVLFLTDDHAAWALRHAGCAEIHTPNLDRLAASGARFTDATTPCPVCSPARASVMTGLMPSEHGIHDWLQEYDEEIGDRDWLGQHATLPQHYQEDGYHTLLAGKWHLGFSEGPPAGFDRAFGMDRLLNAHNGTADYFLNGKHLTLNGNRSQHITDHALQFLKERPTDRPFFLNIGYFATHSPFVEEKHAASRVATYRNATFQGLPRESPHPNRKAENGIPGDTFNESEARRRWRGYFAAVSEIDHEVGRIIDYLQRENLLDSTVIIYTADHGLCLGHHGVWGKGNGTRPLNFYETSLRVPLIISSPGTPAGRCAAAPVTHRDLYQLLTTGQLQPTPGPTFHEYGDARCIRTAAYKLIRRYQHQPDELYDLRDDPDERNNVIADPAHAAAIPALDTALRTWFAAHSRTACDGRKVAQLPRHNHFEAWRDGLREPSTNDAAGPGC
jgi:arylsulfatase A-like enzyme